MSLLWVGQTQSKGGSTAAPGALATIGGATFSPGPGHYEAIVAAGFGSVALAGNDSATNMRLQLAWTGRAGSPLNIQIVAIPTINTMTPPFIVREIDIFPDMLTVTLVVQAILAGTATYLAMLAITPFSL